MDPAFDRVATDPWSKVFHVAFFPDRIYHAEYLNATRSPRYRYNVQEVRSKADVNVLKGDVFLDGLRLCNFLRVEYKGSRLVEAARERHRFLGNGVLADLRLATADAAAQSRVRLDYCPWIDGFQVECWETLEPPPGRRHDYQVLDLMGYRGAITFIPDFAVLLSDVKKVRWVNVSFREGDVYMPSGYHVSEDQAARDDFYERNVQVPNSDEPSSSANTVLERSYGVDFQRGWFVKNITEIKPVRYKNAMMDKESPDAREDNILEMRWVLQQELGGSLVFFHEVTVPPGVVEGTHQHVGSEELYYVVEGEGVAYMGLYDCPDLAHIEPVERDVFGLGRKECRPVPVQPGSVIFTKSGGIHGIENKSEKPLRFVAFLYHGA